MTTAPAEGCRLPGRRLPEWWLVLTVVLAVPILLAAARGVRRGYLPIGDNGLIEIRARDVLTAHHPLLGTWSSASISSGVDVNHPGPLLFDVLALPVRLLGAGPGVAFGVAILQIAVIALSGWSAHLLGGRRTAVAVLAVTSVFVWSIGSELLYDPWQPNLLMLPFFALLVTVWAVVAGHHRLLPVAVLIASFCVQTHLSYVFLAPAMVLLAALAVAWRVWRTDDGWRWTRTGSRPLVLGLVVGVVAWSQPFAEQLFGAGDGNLARLASSGAGGDGVRTGVSLGVRLVSAVVALPPWFGRSGVMDTIPVTQWTDGPDGRVLQPVPGLSGVLVSVLALLAVGVALALVSRAARRRDDRVVASAVLVVGVALVVATLTMVITPIDVLGLSPHKIRWLWPIGAFTWTVFVTAAVRMLSVPSPTLDARVVPGALAGVVVVAALATVPFHAHDAGPVGYRGDIDRIRELVGQLDGLRGRGTVLFDASGLYFAEPFTAPVMAALRREGVPFVLDEEGLVRQMGERRRFDGHADLRVYVREGRAALVTPPGVERVAFRPALTDGERTELEALTEEVAAWRQAGGPGTESVPDDATLDELADLAAAGVIDLTPALGDRTERFVELDRRWHGLALAVFAEPLDG